MKKRLQYDDLLTPQIFVILVMLVSTIKLVLTSIHVSTTAVEYIITMFVELLCLVWTAEMSSHPNSKGFFKTHIVLSLITIAISNLFIHFGDSTNMTIDMLKSLSSVQTGTMLISIVALIFEIQRTKEN